MLQGGLSCTAWVFCVFQWLPGVCSRSLSMFLLPAVLLQELNSKLFNSTYSRAIY
jgi:hypothetical protein